MFLPRLVRAVAALATLAALAATAATAGGHALTASLTATSQVAVSDPVLLASCPPGQDWLIVVDTVGTGTMSSDVYTGPVTFSARHCTRLLLEKRPGTAAAHTVGKNVGVQTIVTDDGLSTLTVAYHGTFVLNGWFPSGIYQMHATVPYTVTDGTGVFAGASGRGVMHAADTNRHFTIDMNGALQLHG